ncbi:MAG: GNAT family N-acetyltransferase [Candidatus Omnitrophota bacterium]
MSIKIFDQVNIDEWQEVADKCEYATFFHTPGWSKFFTETYPEMEIATKKFILDDGIKVILPLVSVRAKGLFKNWSSTIPGVYGGIISEIKIKQNQIDQIHNYLLRSEIANLSITGNPLFNYDLPSKFNKRDDFTHILKLTRSEEEILENYEYSARKQINKAKRSGVVYREANNINEWEEYYSIYRRALKRWGDKVTSDYPLSLFRNVFTLRKKEDVKLWLVIYDEKIVGGNLNFYHNKHCVEWHASFLSDYFKHGIRNFLVHNIILEANARGYEYYDFNPSGGHEGTARFKETFGSQKMPLKRWTFKKPFIEKITSMKKSILENLKPGGRNDEQVS